MTLRFMGGVRSIAEHPVWWDDPWALDGAPRGEVLSADEASRLGARVVTQRAPVACRALPVVLLGCALERASRKPGATVGPVDLWEARRGSLKRLVRKAETEGRADSGRWIRSRIAVLVEVFEEESDPQVQNAIMARVHGYHQRLGSLYGTDAYWR